MCTPSMDILCDQDVKFLRYFKVALAVAIIRQKPEHTSAKQYTEQLGQRLREKDGNWRRKVEELSDQLLKANQQLVQAQLTTQGNVSDMEISSIRDSNNLCQHMDEHELDYLTPPPSSEDSTQETQRMLDLQKHVQFLKSVSFLSKDALSSMEALPCDQDDVINSTIERAISMLIRESGKCLLSLRKDILQSCISGIKELIYSSRIKSHESNIKESINNLVEHLTKVILENKDKKEHCREISQLSHYIVQLGCHPSQRDGILIRLASCLQRTSTRLREVTQGHRSLRTVLHEYNNVYHVLWAVEQILVDTLKKQPCPDDVKQVLSELLEDSLLHISRAFPVFSCYVWKIEGLVNCYDTTSAGSQNA